MTRADVEAEIRRARDRGSAENLLQQGDADQLVEDFHPNLDDADLSGVDLSGLELRFANLRRADLRRATLEDTDLAGAALNDADLTGTTRTRGTILVGANMNFARLGGADLSLAVLRREDYADPSVARDASPVFLQNATYDDVTRWPRDFDPKTYGARRVRPA